MPKRWQQVQPALPPPTSALAYSSVAALTPRAKSIAQAKLAARASSDRSAVAPSTPRFDTASLFRAAEDAARDDADYA